MVMRVLWKCGLANSSLFGLDGLVGVGHGQGSAKEFAPHCMRLTLDHVVSIVSTQEPMRGACLQAGLGRHAHLDDAILALSIDKRNDRYLSLEDKKFLF
jgi:hypothetical protein